MKWTVAIRLSIDVLYLAGRSREKIKEFNIPSRRIYLGNFDEKE